MAYIQFSIGWTNPLLPVWEGRVPFTHTIYIYSIVYIYILYILYNTLRIGIPKRSDAAIIRNYGKHGIQSRGLFFLSQLLRCLLKGIRILLNQNLGCHRSLPSLPAKKCLFFCTVCSVASSLMCIQQISGSSFSKYVDIKHANGQNTHFLRHTG